jgi:hypothetical protein
MVYRIFCMCSTYHPDKNSVCAFLSPKTEQTIQDMKKLRAECLLWSALGSGVAGLPLLRLEAEGRRPWEAGGMGDREFIQRCEKEGIKVFAVLWEAQGYNDILVGVEDGKIVSWMRGGGKKAGYGLDAFYQNRLPGLGKWEDYFPQRFKEGGKELPSLVDACACRSLLGTKPWVLWILPHFRGPFSCLAMCRNSPHWLAYLKRVVELQIEYGARGIQVDETATPFESLWCGAGYCRHCSEAFLRHLLEKYGVEGVRRMGIDPEHFSLRRFLLGRLTDPLRAHLLVKYFPLWRDYRIAQAKNSERTFAELVRHAKEYGRRKGREIEVTGNFAQLLPVYFPLAKHVDFLTFELDFHLPPRLQVFFYKLARSLGGGKEVTAVPSVLTSRRLKKRKAENLLKFYAFEAFSCQANFMAPYSCYTMGKPYYPPLEPLAQANSFIAEHRWAAEGGSLSDATLAFSYRSHMEEFTFLSNPYLKRVLRAAEDLSRKHVLWDVVIFGDGELLPEVPQGAGGRVFVVPEGQFTPAQLKLLRGGKISPSLSTDAPPEVFFSANRKGARVYLHVLNCDYDPHGDRFAPKSFSLTFRAPARIADAGFLSPGGKARVSWSGRELKGEVEGLEIYCLFALKLVE